MSITTAAEILQPVITASPVITAPPIITVPEEAEKTTTDSPIRCSICGKVLRDPKSVERGIGPVCWAKEQIMIAIGAKEGGEDVEE